MRALVVDDMRAIRTAIGKLLKENGFQTLEAGNGKEAIEALKAKGAVDVTFVDWNMPEMNGLEFVQAIRKAPLI